MNILSKLTIKNLKLNKKRAVGTVIGIILSVALICAVAGMVTSFQSTLVKRAVIERGYYHIAFEDITDEYLESIKLNRDVKKVNSMYFLGHSYFKYNKNEPYIRVLSATKDVLEELSYKLVSGSFPQNENEIIISKRASDSSGYKVGDTIKLNVGTRKSDDGFDLNEKNPYNDENKESIVNSKERTYKIVGIVNKEYHSHMYYAITTNEKSDKIEAYVSLKNPRDYEGAFTRLLGANSFDEVEREMVDNIDYNYALNNELLRWEVFKFSDATMGTLSILAGIVIVIIIITSVFCIRNSFAITTMEKMKMYGMLSSVGATKVQIKKSVIYEGTILGIIGVPIGILSGIFAVFVLIKIVNLLIGEFLFDNTGLVFNVTLLPIVISVLLGFITIYLSSIASAIKASRVSPIDNLKNSNDIKIKANKLKVPVIVEKLFKTGGVLAYKNLKRSKKKYRTTVVSLTVSIFIFISMNAFINETFKQSTRYYVDYDYNLIIRNGLSDLKEDVVDNIKKMNNINKSYVTYIVKNGETKIKDMSMVNVTDEDYDIFSTDKNDGKKYCSLILIALDDYTFRSYAKKLNLKYEDVKNKGILCDEYETYDGERVIINRRYKYKKGDIINADIGITKGEKLSIEIGSISSTKAYGFEKSYSNGGYLFVNKDYHKDIEFTPYYIMIDSSNPNILEKEIEKLGTGAYINNIERSVRADKSMYIVISIFLYGFIAVITLIGVTNIFNTITSNMELRQKEFAMLKSVGMTKIEFNRMINLETLFYSVKSLIYGIILGVLGAFLINKAFAKKTEMLFKIPYVPICISIIFVFVIVYIIMKYSISKINKQNTIETIRNENI